MAMTEKGDPHSNTKPFNPDARKTATWENQGKAALTEALIRFERSRAKYLQSRDSLVNQAGTVGEHGEFDKLKAELKYELDRLVVVWRDMIHEAEMEIGVNHRLLHFIQDNMTEFISRSKE